MAGAARGRRRTAGPLVAAAVVGVLLGSAAFAVAPLPVHGTDAPVPGRSASPGESSPATGAASATTGPSPAPADGRDSPSPSSTPAGPPFTERALLQTGELLQYGWAKAAELSLEPGVTTRPLLPCVRPDELPAEPLAAYAATYQGLHTDAAEQVLRLADQPQAEATVDRFTDEVEGCGGVSDARRVVVGTRHAPDLKGVSEAVWWNVQGAAAADPMRGVLAIARVDDRVAVLYLHATVTDPAETTDVVPLLRQAGLRLV